MKGFSDVSHRQESACHAGGLGTIPGSGRSPGEVDGTPPQYSCLENFKPCRLQSMELHTVRHS